MNNDQEQNRGEFAPCPLPDCEQRIQDGDLMNVMRQAVFDTAEIDFKVEYYALLKAYSNQRDALEKASKEIDDQWKLLQTATARIVDLQTHIENLEGEDR